MEKVIIEHNLARLMDPSIYTYQAYIYCHKGSVQINYNDKDIVLSEGHFAIFLTTKMITKIEPSADFACNVIYIDEALIRQSGPRNPYIIQGTLVLFSNPIINLNEKDKELCRSLFANFEKRLHYKEHRFYDEILRVSAKMLLLDLYDIHSRTAGELEYSKSSAEIMTKFISMLHAREYRYNREVAYYAEKLCVVPKYLSEICNKVSGNSASYWINKFTAQDIYELLSKDNMPSAQIAQLFHFTSASYFNRYVKRYLGAYPSELRNK